MKNEKKLHAKHLYFQTDLNKTEIANLLDISRRSLHYWVKEENWDRLKRCSEHTPALLAESCYHLIANYTNSMLSEYRITNPVSSQEAETLHKLVLTANKLKTRNALNDSIELLGLFADKLQAKDPKLAKAIAPHVEEYLFSRASIHIAHMRPAKIGNNGFIPIQPFNPTELNLDMKERFDDDPDSKPNVMQQQYSKQQENASTIQSA